MPDRELSPRFRSPADDDPPVLFLNQGAGKERAGRRLTQVLEVFKRRGCRVDTIETQSRSDLEERAEKFIREGRKIFLGMGGDGTVQGLIQATLGHDAKIGIIPAGGGNDFAAALGLPRDPVEAAEKLFNCEPRPVDVVMARTDDGNRRIYVGGGGIGLDAEAAKYAANHYQRWPGRIRYVAAALHALKRFEPLRVRAQFWTPDFGELESEALLACALNSPTYGGGMRLAPRARVDDGLVDLTLLDYLSASQVIGLVPRLLATGEISLPGMQRVQCTRMRLEPDRRCFFHGDGEIFGPAPVEIEVLPKAACVLSPPGKEAAA